MSRHFKSVPFLKCSVGYVAGFMCLCVVLTAASVLPSGAADEGAFEVMRDDLVDELACGPGLEHQIDLGIVGRIGRQERRQAESGRGLERSQAEGSFWLAIIDDGATCLGEQMTDAVGIGQ